MMNSLLSARLASHFQHPLNPLRVDARDARRFRQLYKHVLLPVTISSPSRASPCRLSTCQRRSSTSQSHTLISVGQILCRFNRITPTHWVRLRKYSYGLPSASYVSCLSPVTRNEMPTFHGDGKSTILNLGLFRLLGGFGRERGIPW